MTVRTWNRIVMSAVILQIIGCLVVVGYFGSGTPSETDAKLASIGLVWMTIIVPCTFGLSIIED
jgi:hypothetical protein